VILVDTGPLVALFDPLDGSHRRCREILKTLREPLVTTVPVLTEAFHMLSPESPGADGLRDFIARGGARIWFFDGPGLARAFELIEQYADHPSATTAGRAGRRASSSEPGGPPPPRPGVA
jgi:predicted nucleic acid-binding protein